MKIGFVGLGNMGAPMAANLIKAGHELQVFDIVATAVDVAVAGGAAAAHSANEAAVGAEIVVSMLPAGEHVQAVYGGDDGLIAAADAGTLFIDCSTIDVATARAVAEEARARGFDVLDAPVSGGVSGAEAGTLTFMVGGAEPAFARGLPVLEAMGRNIVHAGASGNGQAAKICNNMLLGISMIGLSEGLTLAQKLGLDAKTFFEISSKASGSSWAMLNHLPVAGIVETAAANRDFQPGFATAMMLKDLRLAQTAAQGVGAATPLGAQAEALYTLFANAGNLDLDYSAIIKLISSMD